MLVRTWMSTERNMVYPKAKIYLIHVRSEYGALGVCCISNIPVGNCQSHVTRSNC